MTTTWDRSGSCACDRPVTFGSTCHGRVGLLRVLPSAVFAGLLCSRRYPSATVRDPSPRLSRLAQSLAALAARRVIVRVSMNRLVSVSLMTLAACAGEEAAKPDEAA